MIVDDEQTNLHQRADRIDQLRPGLSVPDQTMEQRRPVPGGRPRARALRDKQIEPLDCDGEQTSARAIAGD